MTLCCLRSSFDLCDELAGFGRLVLLGGLNPVAAAAEAGITSDSHAMSTVVDYEKLVKVSEI